MDKQKSLLGVTALVVVGLVTGMCFAAAPSHAPADYTTAPATLPAIDLATGWTLLQEGWAQETIQPDAENVKH